jgi:molybdopterin converting factor small subunit
MVATCMRQASALSTWQTTLRKELFPMARVRIPTPLRKYTQGQEAVTVSAPTIGALIEALEAQHPGLRERILDDKGGVRRFVNIFVGEDDIRYLNHLETPLADTAEVSIVPAIAGG